MKTFLAAGDLLINPGLLAYALVETDAEGPQLRLGFTGPAGSKSGEIVLRGLEARSVLRWLRTNAEFLDSGSPSYRLNVATTSPEVKPGVRASVTARGLALAVVLEGNRTLRSKGRFVGLNRETPLFKNITNPLLIRTIGPVTPLGRGLRPTEGSVGRQAEARLTEEGGAMRGRAQLLSLFRGWDERSIAIDYGELVEALNGLDLERPDLADALAFDDCGYRRASIWRRPHFEALVLCWKSTQCSPIHDHRGSSCAVRVIEGRATETRYVKSPCGRLVPKRTVSYPAGSVLACRGGGTHQMANLEPAGTDLVTLHIYSPPPSAWRFYSLDRTTLAGHDSLMGTRPETVVCDLGHTVPGPPASTRVRGRMPWTA